VPLLDPSSVRFGAPAWLPLLSVPAVLLLLWLWRFAQRQSDRRAFLRRAQGRSTGAAARPSISIAGDLLSWLWLLLALAVTILALARPTMVASVVRTAGIDLVVLQDASASMRVRDVQDDRWRRSMRFLRALGGSLRWEDDRVALALFASIATPQIRLTRDPNTFFFFLDNLEDEPPYRLQDAGTWDTNIERGIYWGLRLVDKDQELLGPSSNARAFVLLSDGQAWSGEVEQSLSLARARGIPVYVIGVGTTAGGVIPEPQRASNQAPVSSRLDRDSLATIATAGGGRYFELGREKDADIANEIIAATRRRATETAVSERTEDLYPRLLLLAAGFLLLSAVGRLV
jgi:Ca-activated chloride channel family protein